MRVLSRSRRFFWLALAAASLLMVPGRDAGGFQAARASVELESLTWIQAEEALKSYGVVLIALGARSRSGTLSSSISTDSLLLWRAL